MDSRADTKGNKQTDTQHNSRADKIEYFSHFGPSFSGFILAAENDYAEKPYPVRLQRWN